MEAETEIVHATTVASSGKALMLRGPSGSGKSALGLELIGLGAQLVSDDRTVVTLQERTLTVSPPATIAGMIEVRGMGVLRLPFVYDQPLTMVVDLTTLEPERVPPARTTRILGRDVTLFWRIEGPHFATALLHLLDGALVER